MQSSIYPIGEFIEQPFSEQQRREWLLDILFLPKIAEAVIQNLDAHQLDTSYRANGWTVKQVIHHLADSHMNAFIRCKLAITENNPIIKPYDQNTWVETSDVSNIPINVSITLLHALHLRWHELFSHVSASDFNRTVMHPEYNKEMSLWYLLGKYAWHGRHHVAQIQSLRDSKQWN